MNENSSPRVAVFGLGLIGSIWARHLDDAGWLAASWNRSPKPDAPRFTPDARAAASAADAIILVVADPPAVAGILDTLLPVLTPRHLLIQSSTIGPADAATFHARVTATGAGYLEAPFTGSKPAAEAKKTVFYLGGDASTLARAEPVLAAFSALRLPCGSVEQACTIKLAMNLQIATMTQGLAEALTLSRTAGIGDDTFFTAMRNNASWSGLAALKEPKLRAGDFSPQFSVKHLLKDLRLLRDQATSLPALDLMIARLAEADRTGHRDEDYSVIMQSLKPQG